MTEFLAALAALPSIISAMKELIGFLEDTFGPDWAARIQDLQKASIQWTGAKTDQERIDAAKALSSAFNSHK